MFKLCNSNDPLFYIMTTACESTWNMMRNINYAGGTYTPAGDASVEYCQAQCIASSTCVAIDYNTISNQKCWIHTSLTGTQFTTTGINHYDLNRCGNGKQYF